MRAGLTAAAGVLAAVLLWAGWLSGLPEVGRALSLSALLGAAFGVVLQRSRFCFYCIARDFIQRREASGLYAVLIALAAGTLGYHAVFGAFLPVPGADRLPPGAHIGPVSVALAVGAFVFDWACGSRDPASARTSTASARARRARPSRCWGRRSASRWALPPGTRCTCR